MATKSFPARFFIGLIIFIASAALLALGVPWIKSWFYAFVWWSFLVVLDGVNSRRLGRSALFEKPADLLAAALVSVPAWLVFELYNLRLKNWSYHDLPPSLIIRAVGHFIAFATVLPALMELAAFFKPGLERRLRPARPFPVTRTGLAASMGIGLVLLALPLLRPGLFFPLVWVGFIFLLEPLNYRAGRASFFGDLEKGNLVRLLSWMAAGLSAGILWESFNFWAGSHWEYHLPYLGFGRIFQMPVLGYLGFIPFALEIFALEAVLTGFYARIRPKMIFRILFWTGYAAFDVTAFVLIETFTVVR
jgi:hypothetical protein